LSEANLEECRFRELPLNIVHAAALRALPPIHNDLFDSLLIAQASPKN
jgi:PIN domain nuclease of toxin-antitoxin system